MTAPLTKMLTFQLRPNVATMLEEYVSHVRAKLPEALRDKITVSVIIRKLLARPVLIETLNYVNVGRKRDNLHVQMRVRMTEDEYAALIARAQASGAPYARIIAALIVEALYPNGNYPVNPDTKRTTATH